MFNWEMSGKSQFEMIKFLPFQSFIAGENETSKNTEFTFSHESSIKVLKSSCEDNMKHLLSMH